MRPGRRGVVACAAFAATAAVAATLGGCGGSASPPAGGAGAAAFDPPPLATTLATASGATWVSVPVGVAGEQAFELFELPSASGKWVLATPPGVATTGGLVLAASGGSLVTAVVPAGDLGFSPLAETAGSAHSWAGGVLPGPVTAAPDALAAAPDGTLYALAGGTDGGLDTAAGGISSWRSLASAAAITGSAGGRACGVRKLTAAAAGAAGPLVGAACAQPAVAGVLARSPDGGWRLAGPQLPAAADRPTVEVVRLSSTAAGPLALLGLTASAGEALVAAWSSTGSWVTSPELPISAGERLAASGTTAAGGFYVLLSKGHADRLVAVSPGAGWQSFPSPPAGTVAAAFPPGGRVDALVVEGPTFVDEVLGQGGGFAPAQTIDVPSGDGRAS